MLISRLSALCLLLLVLVGTLASCTKTEEAAPAIQPAELLYTWQIDQIVQGGQTTSAGASIKDRYRLSFRNDGSYTQTLLSDNTTYQGEWTFLSNNTILHLIDHKGAHLEYTITRLDNQQLRYGHTNKDNKLEEYVFSRVP
ncbi:hypothetical protein LJY25_16660 [Hymenobacter sp. BT175]|uniref:hypothetical protein n=1 Tax=Hymenobacter translucens TaxID=2886507 RepID=UPI001D0E5B6C|nr:hypothetical protein [Hymenobacter translucens]MCC2548083.1 hypothetical protein [Hymenobacter translucens]